MYILTKFCKGLIYNNEITGLSHILFMTDLLCPGTRKVRLRVVFMLTDWSRMKQSESQVVSRYLSLRACLCLRRTCVHVCVCVWCACYIIITNITSWKQPISKVLQLAKHVLEKGLLTETSRAIWTEKIYASFIPISTQG